MRSLINLPVCLVSAGVYKASREAVALGAGSVAGSLVGLPEVSIRLAALLLFGFTGFGFWLRDLQREFPKVFNHFKVKVV